MYLDYHFNAFKRSKGQRVVAEYVVIDQQRLKEANYKHFPDVSPLALVMANEEIFRDYQEVMRLCKTYIADPVVFQLCRKIEKRIANILNRRLIWEGKDRWLIEDKPLQLKSKEDD